MSFLSSFSGTEEEQGAGEKVGQNRDREGTGAVAAVTSSPQAGIIYYSQEQYFHHVQQAAALGLDKFSNDPVLQFFKTYGILREGKNWAVSASRPQAPAQHCRSGSAWMPASTPVTFPRKRSYAQ